MRLLRRLCCALLVVATGSAPGCGGGGGGGGDAPAPVTVILVSSGPQDGSFSNDPSDITSLGEIYCGDSPSRAYRGFVSFDLAPLPAGVSIQAATLILNLRLTNVTSNATLGDILIDHVVYGLVLEKGAYSRSGLGDAIASLSSPLAPGLQSLTITSAVAADYGSRPQSQYRVRFALENNGDAVSDFAVFYSTNSATTQEHRPMLVVTYQP
jgi:hypothetical protein